MARRRPIFLFYHPSMKDLAVSMQQHRPECIELGRIVWGHYPDHTAKIRIEEATAIRGRHVAFLASSQPPASLTQQRAVMFTMIKALSARSMTVLMPYLATATQDRDDEPGEVPMAIMHARDLSNLPMTPRGPVLISIFDLHARQTLYSFGDGVAVLDESFVPIFRRAMESGETLARLEEDAIWNATFPDKGSKARNSHRFTQHPNTMCLKVRSDEDPDGRIVKIESGDPRGHRVIIIDDLGRSGNTLIECARTVKLAGAVYVIACVTHAVFSRDEWKNFLHDSCPVDELWITDSCPWTIQSIRKAHDGEIPSRIRVFPMAPRLVEIVLER